MSTAWLVVLLAALAAVVSGKAVEKRSRACEDLADASIDFLQVAFSLSPEMEALISASEPSLIGDIQINHNTHRETLAQITCQLEDAGSVEELAELMSEPEWLVRLKLETLAEQWRIIGGADGLRRLAEPTLRAFDAFERMGLLNLTK